MIAQKPANPLHPNMRVPLTQSQWEKVKDRVFARSGGRCEAMTGSPRERRCLARIFRATFEPHHVISRAHGGADAEENILACCSPCHEREDGRKLQWTNKSA